jgi:hypothetical protein
MRKGTWVRQIWDGRLILFGGFIVLLLLAILLAVHSVALLRHTTLLRGFSLGLQRQKSSLHLS